MMRRMSAEGLAALRRCEGCVLYAYDDKDSSRPRKRVIEGAAVSGTLTIGCGHTGPDVRPGMTITQQRADDLLMEDVASSEMAVATAVKVPLTDGQFDALVSFVFNVGAGAFRSSTLLRKLNAGDYAAVPAELMRFRFQKGKLNAGLVNRRAVEAGLWAKGSFTASNTVSVTTSAGTMAGAAMDTKTGRAAVGAVVGSVVATAAGAAPVIEALGKLQPAVALAIVVAVAVAVIFMRRHREDAA